MTRPTIGQTVFAPTGKGLKKLTVSKVGSVYFKVTPSRASDIRYRISDWNEADSMGPQLYEKEQEWFDKIEASKIEDYIRERFGRWGKVCLSLSKLRQIKDIIEYEG